MKHNLIATAPTSFPITSPDGRYIGYVDSITASDGEISISGWATTAEVGFLSGERKIIITPKIPRPDVVLAHPALSHPERGDKLGFHLSEKRTEGQTFLFLREGSETHYIHIRL